MRKVARFATGSKIQIDYLVDEEETPDHVDRTGGWVNATSGFGERVWINLSMAYIITDASPEWVAIIAERHAERYGE